MRKLYYTVDVDRDVNIQIPGREAAGSIDRGAGTDPRFSSSERGLGIILDMLDGLGIKGTLFFEGRTAETVDCSRAAGHAVGVHGYDHEDLTALDDGRLEEVVSRAWGAVSDSVGVPTCSRAPYMSADGRVLKAFRRHGSKVDSSMYTPVGGSTEPFELEGMLEMPVPKARDAGGHVIAAYLWPMHEGKRRPDDYVALASRIDGPMVLADHSWHMVETREGGPIGPEGERAAVSDVAEILEGIMDLGFEPAVFRGPPSPGVPARNLIRPLRLDGQSRWNMTARLILGKDVSEQIYADLRQRIAALKAKGVTPGLAVVLVGDDPASQVYVRKKGEMCEALGMRSMTIRMPASTTQEELLRKIEELNADPAVHGFLIQLPLPPQIDEAAVISAVSPSKDVDCFHPSNVGRLLTGDPTFLPATPAGVQQMLLRSGIDTRGKHVVVVGRSNIVGKPMAALMMQRGDGADSTVTVVHSKTEDLGAITRQADILIVAVGKPGFIKADDVKEGAVVIDVGTNRVDDPSKPSGSRLTGDVDFDSVKEKACAITPVPGGVGPMTICMLMANAVRAAEMASEVSQ